ncbi:hypothetical protein KTE91_03335 [Burkholderia multivorans]|uniref:hypothetical protein n=1 Tax=Burkholderia multivorans TaxID=87883 RepID=UPI001C21BB0B|nr:hypothetical protein [Burkholderia multivorans]MBU9434115.1 hypothetical protein [Burkholderia multivorans]
MNFNLKEINKKTTAIIVGSVVLISAIGTGSYFAFHKSKPKQDDPFTLNLPAPKAPEVKTEAPGSTPSATQPATQPGQTASAPSPAPTATVEPPKAKEEVKATPEPQPVKEAPRAAPEQPKHKVKKVRVETRSESAPAVHPAQPVAPQPAPAKAWYQ